MLLVETQALLDSIEHLESQIMDKTLIVNIKNQSQIIHRLDIICGIHTAMLHKLSTAKNTAPTE